MATQKFFRCKHCGNFVGLVNNSGVPMICCGEPMEELIPNTTDGSGEKHVPAVTVEGNKVTVKVGTVMHPALPEHHIEFIYLETENGGQRKGIPVGADPVAEFLLTNDKLVAVYEYCNLHGLWKA